MTGLILNPTTRNAFSEPKTPPARIPIPKDAGRGHPAWAANLAATTPAIATTDPTDRSSPPATITNVTAQLVMPTNETWRSTLVKFSTVKKRSVVREKTIPTRSRIPMFRANVWFVGRAAHVRSEALNAATLSGLVAGEAVNFSSMLVRLLTRAIHRHSREWTPLTSDRRWTWRRCFLPLGRGTDP